MTTTVAAPATAAPVATPKVRRGWTQHGMVFVAPFLLIYVAFLVWPTLLGFQMSLSSVNIAGGNNHFVGFGNYLEAFGDPRMWHSLWNTLVFTVLSTVPLVFLGLVFALLVHNLRFMQWLWRLSFFGPFLLPSAVVSILWLQMIYPAGYGLINGTLGTDVLWLGDPSVAMWSMVLTTVWWTVGFNFLLYLAALQSIPQHLYEAAAIDGATAWDKLRSITLPLLGRTTALIVVLQLVASLKVFDQIYLMTGGGPQDATRPIIEYAYDVGFTGYRTGYASAVSYILFALIVIVSLAQLRLFRKREEVAS
ncbi:N-Acetyl-D-glucosamine ABC transport system, permease protein 1 [[Actinomadura] parvosata subsp. kistnae]|uniref:Sugar ABC transporter permease n=1 Tax=[Actinomadura] parvosata subsp. kistnae TaxID=1909395 RepID=A0A1U9ZS49_9ACTN|nr:sugar ABC transporter permease [Nonomuraea sp. ATCC 55076]AQZ60759.1 sugar ABC transporter permease [Nonomuraea sp. ATCC 55076]SPL90620.1 N-Acetyl-D-glucosamine ABC transport system, permease protein 1 [Actinomadura parvosata subsp. kistnae]